MPPHSDKLAYWLLKNINRAVYEYEMIQSGERVAVALSGGKDSLSLLRLLDFRKAVVPERYEIIAIHVSADARGPETLVHDELIDWLALSGFEYSIVPVQIDENETLPMGCQRCTWNRRKTLFEEAVRLGCSVIAFGHHADDLAQTTLLNLLFHGSVETMAPARSYFDGKIRLIRPLCYTAEKDIRRFAQVSSFPSPPPECPRSDQSRRELAKDLLRQASKNCKDARTNLLRAGLRGNLVCDPSGKH